MNNWLLVTDVRFPDTSCRLYTLIQSGGEIVHSLKWWYPTSKYCYQSQTSRFSLVCCFIYFPHRDDTCYHARLQTISHR